MIHIRADATCGSMDNRERISVLHCGRSEKLLSQQDSVAGYTREHAINERSEPAVTVNVCSILGLEIPSIQ